MMTTHLLFSKFLGMQRDDSEAIKSVVSVNSFLKNRLCLELFLNSASYYQNDKLESVLSLILTQLQKNDFAGR